MPTEALIFDRNDTSTFKSIDTLSLSFWMLQLALISLIGIADPIANSLIFGDGF